jgi:ABC-2 type transport system permease protein
MSKTWIITKRELKSYFDSLMAYILLVLFLGFSGFFTWLYGQNIFFIKQASLQQFFSISYWTLFFFIPAITMGLIAEEKRLGTIEMLFTKPITDWQIITGKFLASFILIAIALALTFPYVITISSLGDLDGGATLSGYLGLLLLSGAYISIGLFASTVTNNQIVSFLLALFIGIFFHLIFGLMSTNFTGFFGRFFDFLSLRTHFNSLIRGVIGLSEMVYFLSIIFTGLFLSETIIAKRNAKD